MNTEENKREYLALCKSLIQRDGIETLLKWLETTDFFTAPASTKFHLAEDGGLCCHSLHVYKRLAKMDEVENPDEYSEPSRAAKRKETVAICGLFHDFTKINFYTVSTRNVKNEKGVWEQVPFFQVEDKLCYGHGEGSVYMINGFMRLTRLEALAIRWHMGGFDSSVKGGDYTLSNAYEKTPFCAMMHAADLMATYIDEHEE